MSITIKKYWHYFVVALLGLVFITEQASVAVGAPPVFLTRLAGVITTWPRNVKFSVGTTTPLAGKLSVYTNKNEAQPTYLFEAASSTVSGTTNRVFSVSPTGTTTISGGTPTGTATGSLVVGCVQTTPTSSATVVKMIFGTVATTTGNGFVLWQYGTCP